MIKLDDEIIRNALNDLAAFEAHEGLALPLSGAAVAAFDRILSRTIPELPKGWVLNSISVNDVGGKYRAFIHPERDGTSNGVFGEGQGWLQAVRAACEAATAKIAPDLKARPGEPDFEAFVAAGK